MEPGPGVAGVVDDHRVMDDHGRVGDDHRLRGGRDEDGLGVMGRGVVCGGDGGAGDGAHGQTADAPPHGILGSGVGGRQGGDHHGQGGEG